MPLIFKSVTRMEFSDEESLEVFVRTLPIKTPDQINLLERETVTDDNDSSDVVGVTKVTHIFSIQGEE